MSEGLDEPGESDKSDEGSGRSRRRFVVGAIKTGTAAGAALWVVPKLSSVALAQETAGSPAPTTSTTEPPEVEPGVEEVPEVSAAGDAPEGTEHVDDSAEVGGDLRVGGLAVTGRDVRTLALAGGAAVVSGEALLLMRRYYPELRLAIAAAGATGASVSEGQSAGEPGLPPPADELPVDGAELSVGD